MNIIPVSKGDKVLDMFIQAMLIMAAVAVMYPLYLVIISSISDPAMISDGQVIFLPKGLNIDAYKKLLETKIIWIGYRNSIFYTIFGTLIALFTTVSAGFVLSRADLPGRRFITVIFILTMYINGGLIPNYILLRSLGMLNTVWALLLPTCLNVYNLIIARAYFQNCIPEEIFESTKIDGANWLRRYFRFALPLAKPMITVLALYFALAQWNSYFNAMIYITSDSIQTLQVIIKRITASLPTNLDSLNLSSEQLIENVRQTQLLKYAVVVVSSIPMILLYPFAQRFLIQGIMIGAVKG